MILIYGLQEKNTYKMDFFLGHILKVVYVLASPSGVSNPFSFKGYQQARQTHYFVPT